MLGWVGNKKTRKLINLHLVSTTIKTRGSCRCVNPLHNHSIKSVPYVQLTDLYTKLLNNRECTKYHFSIRLSLTFTLEKKKENE